MLKKIALFVTSLLFLNSCEQLLQMVGEDANYSPVNSNIQISDIGQTGFTLSWDDTTYDDGTYGNFFYEVFVIEGVEYDTYNFSQNDIVASGWDITTCNVTNLSPGNTYSYVVGVSEENTGSLVFYAMNTVTLSAGENGFVGQWQIEEFDEELGMTILSVLTLESDTWYVSVFLDSVHYETMTGAITIESENSIIITDGDMNYSITWTVLDGVLYTISADGSEESYDSYDGSLGVINPVELLEDYPDNPDNTPAFVGQWQIGMYDSYEGATIHYVYNFELDSFGVTYFVDGASVEGFSGSLNVISSNEFSLNIEGDIVYVTWSMDGENLILVNDIGDGIELFPYSGELMYVETGEPSGGTITEDIYEVDDTYLDAINNNRVIYSGQTQYHSIHTDGDEDWMMFYAEAGSIYTIETYSATTNGDSRLYLYDTDGTTQLEYDDDGGSGLFSQITYSFDTAGTYFIKVSDYDSGVDYNITVNEVISNGNGGIDLVIQ